jgi:hypothetical protein
MTKWIHLCRSLIPQYAPTTIPQSLFTTIDALKRKVTSNLTLSVDLDEIKFDQNGDLVLSYVDLNKNRNLQHVLSLSSFTKTASEWNALLLPEEFRAISGYEITLWEWFTQCYSPLINNDEQYLHHCLTTNLPFVLSSMLAHYTELDEKLTFLPTNTVKRRKMPTRTIQLKQQEQIDPHIQLLGNLVSSGNKIFKGPEYYQYIALLQNTTSKTFRKNHKLPPHKSHAQAKPAQPTQATPPTPTPAQPTQATPPTPTPAQPTQATPPTPTPAQPTQATPPTPTPAPPESAQPTLKRAFSEVGHCDGRTSFDKFKFTITDMTTIVDNMEFITKFDFGKPKSQETMDICAKVGGWTEDDDGSKEEKIKLENLLRTNGRFSNAYFFHVAYELTALENKAKMMRESLSQIDD